MEDVTIKLNEKNQGAFLIVKNGEQLGEMVVAIADGELTVYHTEVSPQAEGKGLAKTLLNAMVVHARANGLKVIALCPYVHAQFKRHPQEFEDIWKKATEDL